MSTEFSFDHTFRAPNPATIFNAYFDADHLATQDKFAELGEREVVESKDDGKVWKCVWKVVSLKPLPAIARPFVEGGRLRYLEQMTWRREANEVDLVVTPQILGGRVSLTATYQLKQQGEGQVHRRYKGSINVSIPLLSGKIERGILSELEKAMPKMGECTQGWLDRNPQKHVTA
jgi:hypothetical protein